MMLVFVVIFIVIQQKTADLKDSQTNKQAEALATVVKTEVELAFSVHEGYRKCFWLPEYINGEEYTVEIIDNIEIVVNYKNKRYLAFLTTNITGQLFKDDNIIIKNSSGVFIEADTTSFCP